MEDFVAYPSRGKIILILLGCLAFVGAGLWMMGVFGAPPESRRYSPELIQAVGWGSTLFFGLCSVMWGRRLFDGREQVRIGPSGIWVRPWSDQTIPWSEIVEVKTWSFRRQTSILLRLRDRTLFPGKGVAAMLAGANRGFTGGDIAISMTGTNRSAEDALAAIDRFRGRAG